jgi:hypothetical protein
MLENFHVIVSVKTKEDIWSDTVVPQIGEILIAKADISKHYSIRSGLIKHENKLSDSKAQSALLEVYKNILRQRRKKVISKESLFVIHFHCRHYLRRLTAVPYPHLHFRHRYDHPLCCLDHHHLLLHLTRIRLR